MRIFFDVHDDSEPEYGVDVIQIKNVELFKAEGDNPGASVFNYDPITLFCHGGHWQSRFIPEKENGRNFAETVTRGKN